jgi:hypothetical protein
MNVTLCLKPVLKQMKHMKKDVFHWYREGEDLEAIKRVVDRFREAKTVLTEDEEEIARYMQHSDRFKIRCVVQVEKV